MVSGISSVRTLFIHRVLPHYIVSFMKTASCVSIHCCLVTKSCLTLCNAMDYSTGSSSVHEISQARIRSELPSPFPGYLPDPEVEPTSPALAGRFFTTEHQRSPCFRLSELVA